MFSTFKQLWSAHTVQYLQIAPGSLSTNQVDQQITSYAKTIMTKAQLPLDKTFRLDLAKQQQHIQLPLKNHSAEVTDTSMDNT